MNAFPVDRAHPPRRVIYRDDARHLVLRPWTLDDVDGLMHAVESSLPELRSFMPWAHVPVTREGTYRLVLDFQADYWAGRQYVFGLFENDARLLGSMGLHTRQPLNPRALEVGYWIRSAEAGRGWTTLAVRMAIVLAFDWLDCDRLQVSHDEANIASGRVVDKSGFSYEGLVRNHAAEVSESMRLGGHRGTGRHRLYSIVPDDLAHPDGPLAWLAAVRSAITVEDALGQVVQGA